MKTHVATLTTTTPILSIRRNTNQAPKSPPRWPLRPGVMVHVRNDTKENLAVNRMTLKPNALLLPKLTAQGSITDSSFSSSALNASINTTQTTLLNGTQDSNLVDRRALNHDQQGNLIVIKKQQQQHRVVAQQHIKNDKNEKYQNTLILPINYAINHSTDDNSMTPTALKNETLRLTEQNPELEIRQLEAVSASNSAPIAERPIKPVKQTNYQRLRNLIANIFFKRSHPCNDDGIRDSQRSHVGLLGGKFWRKPEAGDKSPFAKEHRLKGIRSSGSVTYKKCAKRTTATTTTYSTCTVSATHHHNIANEFENNNINNNGTNHNNLVNNTQTSLYCTVTDSIISTKALTPVTVTAQLAPLTMQHQRPLPASAILIEPSLNISHPRLQNVTPSINNNNVTNNNNTTTTVIQSIPSTIMSSRENRSNTVRNTNSNANNQKSTLKGILKSPTPPPRPAPPLLKRSVSHITTIQRHIEQVQTVQEKSSSMADPLTEPGEYENLPFHGLQTAPNKVLKQLIFNLILTTSSITAHNSASSITNPHQQMPYNLNNCFPKSYTEYYQTQQQQQQQQFTSKFAINNMANATHAQMLNAIEHDYNAFNAGVALVTEGNTKATNPFLAVSNFKKFNQPSSVEASTMEGYNTTSMKRIGKRKTFVDKLEDKRFYSLKFSSGGKNKAQNSKTIGNGEDSSSRTGVVGVLGPLITDSNNKCKRHHSFAGGSVGDIDPKGPSRNPLHFYDTPAYENVNDAVQVHTSNTKSSDMEMQAPALSSSMGTATVLLHPLPHHTVHVNGGLGASSTTGPKKKHHQRQHQPKEDLNLIEPERSSIYRSDSGISNSSYECVTPVPSHGAACSTPPPGKTPRAPKTPKTPKTHKTNSLIHSTVTANFNSAHKKQAPRVPPTPLYINVNSDSTASPISNLERPSSPNSAVATSAYESASSSQNDGTCADPASLSSCTSLYSGKVTSVSRCSRHQQPPEITTPEEYEQYQLGHHPHGGHSSSSLSVASSVSGTGVNASAWTANTTASTTAPTTICRKKLRRQTISDPYAHIKYISDCRKQHLRLNTVTASKQNRLGGINETYNYCSESTSAFKATTAAANVDKSQQQQQINLQPYNAIDYVKQSELHQSHHRHHDHPHCYEQLQQQQHQQQQQLGFTHSQHTQQMLMSSSGNIDDIDDDGNNDRSYNDRKYSPHSCYLSYSHDDNDNYNYTEEMGETAETLRSSQILLTTDRKLPETTNTGTIPSTLIDFTARPIKLPLRKYHSFHFQTSQTVAGQQQGNLKMRQQKQLQVQAYTAEHPVKHHYSKEGPLVFLPLCLNENSTFKPIVSTEESEGDDSTEISINDELEQYSKSTPIANLIRCTSSLNIKNSELNNQSPTIDKSITKLSKVSTIAKREPYEQIDKSKENTATVVKPISKSKNLLLSRIINNSPEVIKIQDFTNSNRDEIYITSKTLIRSPPVLKTKNMSTQSKGKAEASAEIFKKDVCEPNLLKSEQMTRGSPSQIGREENEFVEDIKLSSNTALFKAGSFKDDSNRFALNEGKFEYNARMDVNPENKNLTFSGQCFQTLNHKKNIGKFPDASKCIDMYKVMPESLACTGSNKGCPTLPSLKSMTEDCNEKSNQTHDNTFSTRNIKSPLTPLKTLKLITKSNPELWYNTHTGNRQKLHQLQLFHSMQNLKNSHKSNRNTSADVVDKEQEAEDEEDLGYTFYEDENDNDINDNDSNDNDK
uniref:Uncharacterized protein n=1 Tax=Glossina palpalis gambiensis TaxID=67801 RepID=A0A1B0B4L7_9MUSC